MNVSYTIKHDEKNNEVFAIYGSSGRLVVGSTKKYYLGKTAKQTNKNLNKQINALSHWLEGYEACRQRMASMF